MNRYLTDEKAVAEGRGFCGLTGFRLECRKEKRTGLRLSFFGGGLLGASVPILNMAVRAERYLGLEGSPVQILMEANWQLMAMLNVLLAVAAACLMYHMEYADGAMQRMRTLPWKERGLFFGKFLVLVSSCIWMLAVEAAAMAFCVYHWYGTLETVWMELLKGFGYALCLMLPAASGALFLASLYQNMWIPLGIGVVCVFTATMLSVKNFVLSLFPFAMPFQTLAGTAEDVAIRFVIAAMAETVFFAVMEIVFLKVRRKFT